MFHEEGDLQRKSGEAIGMCEPVTAGEITYRHEGSEPCQPRRGPRFHKKFLPPVPRGSEGTYSDSGRSSPNQNNFKLGLIARDGRCVISGCWFDGCVGAHILPVTRPEYYGEVLGHGDDPHYIFETEYGLLLSDTLHHAWDRGELALYPQEENLIVHIFNGEIQDWLQYHGKILTPSHFRSPPHNHPDRGLLAFHYQQCAMMKLRGFAAEMDLPST